MASNSSTSQIYYFKDHKDTDEAYEKLRASYPDIPSLENATLAQVNAYLTLGSYGMDFDPKLIDVLSKVLSHDLSVAKKTDAKFSTSVVQDSIEVAKAYIGASPRTSPTGF
ncbi:hypothetical protein F4818DRAFT_173498 [Hypoxylon cercidicola]|nr:hypothetical protein F4818DRAFT_173498 [Hypoxylon cercidicola]